MNLKEGIPRNRRQVYPRRNSGRMPLIRLGFDALSFDICQLNFTLQSRATGPVGTEALLSHWFTFSFARDGGRLLAARYLLDP